MPERSLLPLPEQYTFQICQKHFRVDNSLMVIPGIIEHSAPPHASLHIPRSLYPVEYSCGYSN